MTNARTLDYAAWFADARAITGRSRRKCGIGACARRAVGAGVCARILGADQERCLPFGLLAQIRGALRDRRMRLAWHRRANQVADAGSGGGLDTMLQPSRP
jgi:hypothetical protein